MRRDVLGDGSGVAAHLDNRLQPATSTAIAPARSEGVQRIAEVPIHAADAIVRRAPSLQKTRDAAPAVAWVNNALADRLGLRSGDQVRVVQGAGEAIVPAAIDDKLPADCVRLAAARPETAALGAMFGTVSIERVAQQQKVAV